MPNSRRRQTAAIRSQFTGESSFFAARGIPRDRSIGLDQCTQVQQRLRAYLALYLFNSGKRAALPDTDLTAAITMYSLVVSAHRDKLILITNAPANVAARICCEADSIHDRGVPGMRLAGVAGVFDSYYLHHLPTGGTLVVTQPQGHLDPPVPADTAAARRTSNWALLGQPMSRAEENRHAAWPAMSPSMTPLLAGLVTRLNLSDPGGSWATGTWFWDPLQQSRSRPDISTLGLCARRLWGSGDDWALSWEGYPFAADLICAMTDPVAGVAGLTVLRHEQRTVLCLGSARLTVIHTPKRSRSTEGRVGRRAAALNAEGGV
ncbi:hypothetical protein [Virgisporangium aurantiacum]|uniref:Uncharacterized protein n=1 Tax=Virgisporangium aurantiacum TaxID=175570 RepID=A0A8J3Z4F4_9ACTN|nr:hypothetical protein [Virgisporangium aurantiacum]GIJ56088.1 hypothetical protein Vau01_036040 [Virgisporangium aurantiacum]